MSSNIITIGQICEMQPGTKENAVWINDEFEAVVTDVKTKQAGQKTFFTATLQDPHSTNISIAATLWITGVPAKAGKICRFSGQGIKLEDYKGNLQLSIGEKAKINVVGAAPGAQPSAPAAQRQANPPASGGASGGTTINGATVGMAINQAIGIIRDANPGATLEGYYHTTAFSADLHTTASDILRVSAMLEKGKLAQSAKLRNDPEARAAAEAAAKAAQEAAEAEAARKAAAEAAAKARKIQPAADGHNVDTSGADEDVPF